MSNCCLVVKSYNNYYLVFIVSFRSPFCEEIVCCRGDHVRLAVRVRVFAYPESACAVWIMFACKYRSVLWQNRRISYLRFTDSRRVNPVLNVFLNFFTCTVIYYIYFKICSIVLNLLVKNVCVFLKTGIYYGHIFVNKSFLQYAHLSFGLFTFCTGFSQYERTINNFICIT